MSQGLNISKGQREDTSAIEPGKSKELLAFGGVIGAILSASCCVLPLALFSIGVSGAWMGNLTQLAPYQPIFVGIAILFLGTGYWKVYRKPKAVCDDDSYCASPKSDRLVKVVLWLSTALITIAISFPYYTPYLLGL